VQGSLVAFSTSLGSTSSPDGLSSCRKIVTFGLIFPLPLATTTDKLDTAGLQPSHIKNTGYPRWAANLDYNYLGKTYVHTVASYGICPLSVRVNPAPTLPAPSGMAAFKTGENVRGAVKDCFYKALGRNYVLTVASYELCPISAAVP
jgi:hypothetical protein